MNARIAALVVAALVIALAAAQDFYPKTALYHTWQYALAMALGLVVTLAYANGARRGTDGVAGKRLLLAMAGAVVAGLAGLASGLLGPDTAIVSGTPGTVVPIPALGAAAFFGAADADTIARASAAVILRRRSAGDVVVGPSTRRALGESLLYLEPHPAAYVDVYDERGAHLTVTQPTNASFLSPVLLFHQRQRIGALDVPFDTFNAPGQHRVVRALYFTPHELAQFSAGRARAAEPTLVLSVADDAGRPLGIVLAGEGRVVTVAGLRVRATVGAYPELAVAAAPPAWALIAGAVLFVAGLAWSVLPFGGLRAGAGDVRGAVVHE